MRNKGLMVLILAVAAGCLTYFAMRWHKTDRVAAGVMLDSLPELEWLRVELKFTDSQFARVRDLHLAYRPRCAEMCRRISAAHVEIEALAKADRDVTPGLSSALGEHARIHVECQEAMLRHLYQTAALLNEDQARHYLEILLPYALDFSHSESGSLHGP